MDQNRRTKFLRELFGWWEQNKRILPWRETKDPYKIMVSEFMLQQTQVNRVIDKYNIFVKKYSNLESLAKSKKIDLLKLWQGLGYNRRALWLKDAAIEILKMGRFPSDKEELIKLKGIGEYTSRAIPIFAFNKDYAAVDTNIKKILLSENFIHRDDGEKEIQRLADKLMPKGSSRDYHNAMMDLGSSEKYKNTIHVNRTKIQKFKNSNRQVRGKIISILVNNPIINYETLFKEIKKDMIYFDQLRFDKIIEKLEKDKLITFDGEKITIN